MLTYILMITIFTSSWIIASCKKSLKFERCGKKFSDGKRYKDDFIRAAVLIRTDWNDFETEIEKAANVNIKKCLKKKLYKGKIKCIKAGRKWPNNCQTAKKPWGGKAVRGANSIKICEPSVIDPLKNETRNKRLTCLGTIMIHEFAHNCWRGHKSVNKIDKATFYWMQDKLPFSGDHTSCPGISPGQEALPQPQLYPDGATDYFIYNHPYYINGFRQLLMYFIVIILVLLILYCMGIISLLLCIYTYCFCNKKNQNEYDMVKSDDIERAIN